MKRDSSSFIGIIIILVGIFFFLNNLGLLNLSMLYPLASWWSVGLIIAGIALVYQRTDLIFFILAITFMLFIVSNIGNISMFGMHNFDWSGIDCITPTGDIISETRTATGFTGIAASRAVNVYLTQGTQESIRVEAPEDIIDNVITEIQNTELKISFDSCIRNSDTVKVYVTTDTIDSLSATSAGEIIGTDTIEGEKISINANSAGVVDVTIDVESAELDASSAGRILIEGTAPILDIDASSSGIIYAYDLLAKDVKADVSSAGIIQISVSDTLDASASSMGKIQYRGTPTITDQDVSSAGVVQKA